MHQGTIGKLYGRLEKDREAYLARARAAASVTIPSLFPPQGADGTTELRTPWQSFGARAVNTLSAKIVLTILPPNQPFFRATIDESDLPDGVTEETTGEIESKLSDIERMATRELDVKNMRPSAEETVKQLIVAGNGLLYVGEENTKFYRLDKYVVSRDGMGNTRDIVICEPINMDDVPRHIKPLIESTTTALPSQEKDKIKLYTHITRNGNHWVLNQEINGIPDPKARSVYPLDRLPYIPLRMIRVDGEDYGRGYVEEYLGDLKSIEMLSKALNEGTLAAARLIFMRNPNSVVKLQDLNDAPNGGFVDGNAEDVSALQMEKQADFNQARQRIAEITEGLSAAFLMNSSLTRQAERVTATEVRAMAQELETVLGGVYALLANEFQLPLVEILLGQLQRDGKMPEFPQGVMKPQILTGIAALGRTQELDKLRVLLEYLTPFGPEIIAENMNVDEYIKRVTASIGLETDGLVPTLDEKDARQKAKELEQLATTLGPQAMQNMQS
jgi:hypothetical protein